MRAAKPKGTKNGRPRGLAEQAQGGRKGRVKTALTRVVPAPGRACDQKQKEAEKRTASVRSGPTGRGHGAGRRWCAATGHSRTGTGAVEIRAQMPSDARNSSRGEGKGVCLSTEPQPLRRSAPASRHCGCRARGSLGESCWPRPLV